MADAVTVTYIHDGPRQKVLHLTNISDATGETAVNKLDISTILAGILPNQFTPTYTVIDKIVYAIQGFKAVNLLWDHTTDDLIATLPAGWGVLDFSREGGRVDPKSSGGTGDILLTTLGAAANANYDIILYVRPKP